MQKERVGVLLVHGIGQQLRYGHLEPEVAQIAKALREQCARRGYPAPVIRAWSRASDLRGASYACWADQRVAPVVIQLQTPAKLLELHFREVWWADLDDPISFWTALRFYGWALGMWLHPGALDPQREGRVRMPGPSSGALLERLLYRAYLFLVGLVVFLALPLSLIAWVLRRYLFAQLPANLLAEYLGDVKLYQDDVRVGPVRLEDLFAPPRVSIRARMVRALVEMALARYDRWYVCAHSLGSVIAFNGLMETEQALPNYLDDASLARCRRRGLLIKVREPERALSDDERAQMLPARPQNLHDDEVIDRAALFSRLRGIMTYGCPLERFRALWPSIVPINREAGPAPRAFRPDLEWLNLLDPSDPVASALASFDPKESESHPAPQNIVYRSGLAHLLSHIKYLSLRRGPCAARALSRWLTGDEPDWHALTIHPLHAEFRRGLKLFGWLAALVVGVYAVERSFVAASEQLAVDISWPGRSAWLAIAFLVVLCAGPLYRLTHHLAARFRLARERGDGPPPGSVPPAVSSHPGAFSSFDETGLRDSTVG